MELLLAQPLRRSDVFLGEAFGNIVSLTIAYCAGFGLPILIFDAAADGAMLLLMGVLLTAVFSSLAMLVSVNANDKAKGIGISLLVWLTCTLLYDGLVLFFMMNFSDYPIENSILILTFLNPVDLARISLLMKMDIAVIMGYSGAIYKNFLGSQAGIYTAVCMMLLWVCVPVIIAMRKFSRKDI
jgi:Cu-processing system permease protein